MGSSTRCLLEGGAVPNTSTHVRFPTPPRNMENPNSEFFTHLHPSVFVALPRFFFARLGAPISRAPARSEHRTAPAPLSSSPGESSWTRFSVFLGALREFAVN